MIEASSKQERVGVGEATSRVQILHDRQPKLMAISVVMPALEMAQETGKLISWLKKEGETVAKGEPLLEIETDKAVMEIESPGDGVLAGIKVQAGADGARRPDDCLDRASRRSCSGRPSSSGNWEKEYDCSFFDGSSYDRNACASSAREIKISPKARRLAAEHGVDLSRVQRVWPGR